MKLNFGTGVAIVIGISGVYFIGQLLQNDWAFYAPNHERVRILERTKLKNGSEELVVRLTPDFQSTVKLDREDELHPDAQFVCVGIFGDPESGAAKATYAELSNCPLPVSRALPLSGRTNSLTTSGKKTFRSMSGTNTSESSSSQFPKSSLGFGKSQ